MKTKKYSSTERLRGERLLEKGLICADSSSPSLSNFGLFSACYMIFPLNLKGNLFNSVFKLQLTIKRIIVLVFDFYWCQNIWNAMDL